MTDLAISIKDVSKMYRIVDSSVRATTLAEAVTKLGRSAGVRRKAFWALRDVSLEVGRGEVLGIVGRNGAGKSTLLKILSRITEPTSGCIDLFGRVGSLLEVGTGFHPELTGRENIYLNGAILGMRRREITAQFESIVEFAGIRQFLDTPVKRYSSGMYVRLAFAVAAHLSSDILLVDEVLAVGDTEFQRKCIGKMRDVTTHGRTIVFVSHNMGAISALTSKALYLNQGQVVEFGPTRQVVNRYLADHRGGGGIWTMQKQTAHPLQIVEARVLDNEKIPQEEFEADTGFVVEVQFVVRESVRNVLVEFYIFSADGVHLLTSGDHDTAPDRYERRIPGTYCARIRIPGDLLNIGDYVLKINSGTHRQTYDHEDAILFRIIESRRLTSRNDRRGLLLPMLPWEIVEKTVPGQTL